MLGWCCCSFKVTGKIGRIEIRRIKENQRRASGQENRKKKDSVRFAGPCLQWDVSPMTVYITNTTAFVGDFLSFTLSVFSAVCCWLALLVLSWLTFELHVFSWAFYIFPFFFFSFLVEFSCFSIFAVRAIFHLIFVVRFTVCYSRVSFIVCAIQ